MISPSKTKWKGVAKLRVEPGNHDHENISDFARSAICGGRCPGLVIPTTFVSRDFFDVIVTTLIEVDGIDPVDFPTRVRFIGAMPVQANRPVHLVRDGVNFVPRS